MISKKTCKLKDCKETFYGTERRDFCCSNHRVKHWRDNMFNVDMRSLVQPIKNRGLEYEKRSDGTVTINGKNFDRERDVEDYLMTIPRKDIPGA
jgi:hypothetical protein